MDKLYFNQCLLICIICHSRKELETRVTLNGSAFQEAVLKEVTKEQQMHEYRIKELQEKNNMLNQNYMDLENEFRVALTIEAKRFTEVRY